MPQQPTTVVLGWEQACRISQLVIDPDGTVAGFLPGVFFGITAGSIVMDADKHECGDSLSGFRKRYKAGRTSFAANLKFYEKWDVDLSDDFNLVNGAVISLEIFTQGVDENDVLFPPYTAPNFVIFAVHLDHDEEGKINGSLEGMADGAWYRPGETIPP